MKIRRLQGWALLVILPINLLSFVAGDAPWYDVLLVISVILFIFGVPAIQSVQPMGTAGLTGVGLILLSALIAVGINVFGGQEVSEALIATSVFTGAFGRFIIGWLTTKKAMFPTWAGWAFLLQGVLNLGGYLYLYNLGTFGSALGTVTFFLDSVAAFGYGLRIAQGHG